MDDEAATRAIAWQGEHAEQELAKAMKTRHFTFNPEEFHDKVGVAVKKAIEALSPEKMVETLIKDAHQQRQTILLKMMGFDNRWHSNNWEIDRTNGRENPIHNRLQEALGPRIEQWIDEVFAENEKSIEKKAKAAVRKALLESNDYTIRKMVEERTVKLADQLSNALFKQLASEYREQLGVREPIPMESAESILKEARKR